MESKALERVAARLISKTFPAGRIGIIKPLAGDASSRKYYRVEVGGGEPVVLMLAPDEQFIDSFFRMSSLMRALRVDTPEIFDVEENIAELEDCGDVLLQDYVSGLDKNAVLDEYRKIIDGLLRFQALALQYPDKKNACFSLNFDVAKLTWETEFAHKHFLKGYKKLTLSKRDFEKLRLEWDWIIKELAEEMEVLTHRDFHSRNIMIHGNRRVWIDYQDARMGRRQYDLASLLYDPYVALPANIISELIVYYYTKLSETSQPPWGFDKYMRLVRLSGLQRIYKALGTYGYQVTVNKVKVYEAYIPPSIETLRMLAGQSPDLRTLDEVLLDRLA